MTDPLKEINALDGATDPKVDPKDTLKEINTFVGGNRVSPGSAMADAQVGIDHSYLDKETPFGISLPEQRAKNQSTTDKWLSGGIKGLSTFVTATGQTVGAVGGGIAATAMSALGNDFDSDLVFKNPVLEFFADWNTTVKERNPNYYSQAEMNDSVLENMATANFWSDKFLDGVGFMASAIMTGYGAAKFGAAVGLNIASKAGSGFNTFQAALIGRTGESAIEANDAYEQTLEKLKDARAQGKNNYTDEEIEDLSKDARAATFGFNMAIAVTDAYQFGKIFKTIEGQAVKKSLFGGSRVAHATEQILIESQEENYQLAVADMAINMANNISTKGTERSARDYFNNVVGGMMDNFNTKEGQESMLLGGLLGGGMGLAMHSNEHTNDRTKEMTKNVPEEIKKRNNKVMSVFNKDVDAQFLERVAATQNDGIVEGLAKNLQLINLTLSKIKSGEYEGFMEELKEMSKQTVEAFQEIGITVTKEDIAEQYKEAKNQIEGYKALYDAMDPEVFDRTQENAVEAVKANLFYVTAARNDIRTQLQKVGPYVAAVKLAQKTEPDLAMDEPFQVGKDQVIPNKVIAAQEKLVENRDALTKYITRVKTGKKLQKEIVDAYNEVPVAPIVEPTKPSKAPEIGSLQKIGVKGEPAKYIPFTKAVPLEDGSTNYTTVDSEGIETIVNDRKDEYAVVGFKGEFRGERQELNNNERYNFLQVFKKFVTEEDLDRLQEILSRPDWKENVRFTANKQNTGGVVDKIKNFIAKNDPTGIFPTPVQGTDPMYLIPSSFLQIEMQIKDKDDNWTRMGHPGSDPFKWRDKNGAPMSFASMELAEFKKKFVFKQGPTDTGVLIEPTQESLEQIRREQKEAFEVYNAINIWYEKNGFTDLTQIPEGFIKAFPRKLGFAYTKVGEWSKAKAHTMLKDKNDNYVIIDMHTGKNLVDGQKHDVPAHIRKELGDTRYIAKVNHPTIDDIYIKAAPEQLAGTDNLAFITKLNEVRENPTQEGAEELNEILYVAYQGNWNFKFDVHTIKGTKNPKLVMDVFNDQQGIAYKNIPIPINVSSFNTLTATIKEGTDGKVELNKFAYKKHISKESLTNSEVEQKFTFNTTPEIIHGAILQFKFNQQAPVEPKVVTPTNSTQTDKTDIAARKAKAQAAVAKKGNDAPVFKHSAEKASEVIQYKEALKWLEKILPKGIKVADMATVTENLETQGYTWGMFANKVVYLSTQAQQGTEAHEAFHAIFRIMLTEAERAKLYTVAQAKWGKGKAPLFYEEKMADEFMDWKNARNRRVSGSLQAFFNRVVQFAKFVTGRESELERLFRKIEVGAFTDKALINNSVHAFEGPAYKLLKGGSHYKMSVVRSEHIIFSTAAYVLEQLNNNMEYQKLEGAVSKLTSDYMFAQGTNYDIALDVNQEIIEASEDKYTEDKMLELEAIYSNQENVDLVTAEVLKLVRAYEIRSIDQIINEQDETEESFKAFDIHQGEYGGWANVSKEIKQFIALTTFDTLDDFNKHITRAIDFVLVYGALQRRLSGKSRAQQLLSFESFARTDEQVNALWNKFLVETGYDPTTGVKTNEYLFNRFMNTFELEDMDYLQSLRVEQDGVTKLINMSANRAGVDVIHFENWERKASEYNIFSNQDTKDDLSDELIFEAAKGFAVDSASVPTQESLEPYVAQIRKSFAKMGIDLSEGYVLESLEAVHRENIAGNDPDVQYRMLEEQDIYEVANLLKKGDNIFEQKVDEDGNLLKKTGARGRLIALASGDVNYRTDIYDSNFQDAENKSRYSFVYPSYILTKIRDMHNITEADLQQMKEDPYYKYNPLVQSAKSADWFFNLKAAFTGDYRDTVEDSDGKTFKSTTPKDLLLSWYGLYNANKDYSYVTPMIYEAKSTSISVNLPNKVNNGKDWVDKNGKINDDTIRFFIDTIFMQEHERINGNTGITFRARKENPWVTLPYFNGENMKYKNKYLTDYSKQDIIDKKDGVREFIGKAIAANLTSEIEAHQAELEKYGIIKGNENVLLDSDIDNVLAYTAEYYVNDLVNSVAISQIIQGDLSKAKNPFDRVKRNGGELAYGTHFGEGTYRVAYKTEDKREDRIDRDDAQVYVSVKRRIDQLERLGRLTDKTRAILEKIREGQTLSDVEYKELDLLPLKTVHYGDQNGYMIYDKMSETVLSRDLTSKLVKRGDQHVWVAKKGKEKLHNMLEFMEDNEVDSIVTMSASKLENPSEPISDEDFINGVPAMGDRFTDLDNRYLRLQVEMHSGKEKIVSGTQMAQLIDLLYEANPKLKERYYQLLGETRAEDFSIAEYMAKPEHAKNLANKLIDALETSGGDAQMVELLSVVNGEFKYNFNLPHVAEKLEQLLLSHFSKGVLQQKVPGYKLTLMSSSGYKIEDKETGEVRELKTHQVSKDGKVIELAEVAMTRRALRKILGPTAKIEDIDGELLEMVGTRIPTQAHHSMIPFKVVEFLPEYYGDTIIAPAGIVKLSGADYDIDSLFVYRKDFYMDEDKKVHIYGKATTEKGKYDEYLQHHLTNKTIINTRKHREISFPEVSKEKIRQEVFKEYGLEPTFEDWKRVGSPSNNSNRNNELVDTYLTILADPSVEDMFEPATLDLLKQAVATIHDTLRNKGNENATVNHYGANGKLKAHTATSTGKRNVGPVAFINNVAAFMTKHSVKMVEPIGFLGREYWNYGETTEKDIVIYQEGDEWKVESSGRENLSKINSLSTMVSGMTDDAKWGFSAKLNLEEFNLGIFANLIALGVGFNGVMLFSSQDILAEVSSKVKSSGEPHDDVLYDIITEKENELGEDPVLPHLKPIDLVHNLQPGERTKERDLAVLYLYRSLLESTQKLQAVGTAISLNKGAEVINVVELKEKIDRLDTINIRENGKNPFYTNLWDALTENANTNTNMRLLHAIDKQMEQWFIAGTPVYEEIVAILTPTLRKGLKTKDKVTIDRAIKSFLTARGYQRMIENYGSDIKVADFNALIEPGTKNSLIEKTLARQIQELSTQKDKKLAKEFNSNEFVKILRTQFKFTTEGILNKKNESELDLVTSNMRIKRNPQTVDRVINGFIELSLDHPELAKNLFRYSMAKDNLQFNSTSFLKFIDVTYLGVASQGLDSIVADPEANEGMQYDFAKLFAGYSPNNALFSEKKMVYLKQVGSFNMKTGGYTAKVKKERKGLKLPPSIFKVPSGHVYYKNTDTTWERLESFGNKYQLPYHMLYDEALALSEDSISDKPSAKVNTDQELIPKVGTATKFPATKEEALAQKPKEVSNEEKIAQLEEEIAALEVEDSMLEEDPHLQIYGMIPKLTIESVKKETGLNIGSTHDIATVWVSKTKGISIARASENIWAELFSKSNVMSEGEVKDFIIDAIQHPKAEFIAQFSNKEEIQGLKDQIKDLETKPVAPVKTAPTTITYTPKGKAPQTYTIEGDVIKNKDGAVVFKEDSVDRNRIFANVAVKADTAKVVEYKQAKYVVHNDGRIISVATGKQMNWDAKNGNRIAILTLAQEQVTYKPSVFPRTKEEALAGKVRKSKNILSKEDSLDTLISYNFGKAIKRLSKAFGIKVTYIHDPNVNWSGRYQHGVVELNLALLQSDTAFHEFAHPFVEAIRAKNSALYNNLVAEIKKEGKILAKVIEQYPELDDAGRIDEAIVTAIGMYGAQIANMPKSLVEKVKEFLQEVMRFIQSLYTPGTMFLPSELNPNTTLKDVAALMTKNTQVFDLGELTDEQARYQKQQASKLTVDQDHVGVIVNGVKTSSLREVDPDLEHKVGEHLAVYANSRSQGIVVELTGVKTLKSLKDINNDDFAKSLGYDSWADFTEQNKYAKKDSPAALQFPALYDFLHGEGEMQLLTYKKADVVPQGRDKYLEERIKKIKTAIKKQLDRYNAILTRKGNTNEKIKLFVKRRERLLKTIDAIDDASGVANYIQDARDDLKVVKSELKGLMNKIGNVRNLNDKQRKAAINELNRIQENIIAYEEFDQMSRDEVEDHLGDTELAKVFGKAKNDYESIKKNIDKTAIPLLASWLLEFHDIDSIKATEYFDAQIKRTKEGNKSETTKTALILKLEQQRSEMVLTQRGLEDQLREATQDIGFGSLWLEAAASSSDQVTALFSKAVKFQEFKANFQDRLIQEKLGAAEAAYEKEQGKAGSNIDKFYGDFIKTAVINTGKDLNGDYVTEERFVFKDVEEIESPAGKELLTVIKEIYNDAQELLPESQSMKVEDSETGVMLDSLPFVRRSGADRIRSNGILNTLKAEFQEIYKPLATDVEYGYTTEAGEVIKSVPIHYTRRGVEERAMDNKDISKDIVASMLLFTQMSNKYSMFKEIQSEVEFMEQAVSTRAVPEITPSGNKRFDKVASIFGLKNYVKSDTSRVNQRLQEFINMTYYGMQEKPNIQNLFGQEIDVNKLLNFLGKWTGFTTLALNFLSALNNVILGNFYIFQESVARQNFGDLKLNLAEGKAIYYKGSARMMGDIGKIAGLSKETQLVRMYDAMQGTFRDVSGDFVTGSKAKKLWQGSTLFFMNHIGEHEMQVSSLFSAMAGQKLETTAGEEISLWDAYSLDEKGNITIREDVEWYDTDVFEFQNKLHATNKALHGNYNDFDKTVMQKHTLGRLALMFRKFMAPGVRRRFGKLSIDNELSELHEGFFVTTYRLLLTEMRELKDWALLKENNLTEHEKANLKKTVAEIGMWVTTMAMFAVAAGFLGDDDDSWAGALVLYEIKRLQTELGFYFNPAETLKIIKSPAATTTTIERIITLGDQMLHAGNYEYTHYKTSGRGYEKGDSKVWRATKRLIPAIQGIERSKHPEEAIKYFEKLF